MILNLIYAASVLIVAPFVGAIIFVGLLSW